MGWIYLLLAGVFEIGWPVAIKIYQAPDPLLPVAV